MGWPNQARYWKGSWQSGGNGKGGGGKPGKGKAPTSQKENKEMEKPKDGERDLIPDYDKIPGGQPEQSSSSAPSTSTDNLRKVVKAIAESNTVSLPAEALKLLQEDPEEELKQESKKTQQFLNRKRKVHGRVVRLKESLATKHKQFVSFKELMKEKLISQQEKYEEDVRSLESSIKEAEAQLKEMGEEESEVPATEMDTEEPRVVNLEELLEIKKEHNIEQSEKEQLLNSRMESLITKRMFNNQAQQLQMYMEKLESMQSTLLSLHAGHGLPPPPGFEVAPSPGASASPQLTRTPNLGKRKMSEPLGALQPQPAIGESKKQRPEVPSLVEVLDESPKAAAIRKDVTEGMD